MMKTIIMIRKRILLTLTGTFLIGCSVLYAQTDTSRNRLQQRPQPTQPPQTATQPPQTATQPPVQPPQPTSPARQGDQYRTQDMIVVPQDQMPSTLRQTLQGNQYKGWENSTIYQDRTTGEYALDLNTGNATQRTYRFDKNGRMIDNVNRPQQSGGTIKDQ